MHADVIIIGAGLAGLSCALTLEAEGHKVLLLEASDRAGGRLRTDQHEGFLLDRGFLVLQTWYPAAQRWLDYEALDLRPFHNGALLRFEGQTHRITDVWRSPQHVIEMLRSAVGTLGDKLRLLRLRQRALSGNLRALYSRSETTALAALQAQGFTPKFIERFFLPFFSGVFFDPQLSVSSRSLEFVFRAFALGNTALPARGMQAISDQLASRLNPGTLQCHTTVQSVGGTTPKRGRTSVVVERGLTPFLEAKAVVVATDARAARRLLGEPEAEQPMRRSVCVYYAADEAPIDGPYLLLNSETVDGKPRGVINSVLCPSNLSRHYAPPDKHLITVNLDAGDTPLETLLERLAIELRHWFGAAAAHWQQLKVYELPEALPMQAPPVTYPGDVVLRKDESLWVCGEYASAPSFQWALHNGERAAQEVLDYLAQK